MSDKFEKIKKTLEGLRNRTVAHGASESEAFAAAEIMRRMLDKYGLTEQDIEDYSNGAKSHIEIQSHAMGGAGTLHEFKYCAMTVASFFDCKCYAKTIRDAGKRRRVIVFVGFPEDVACCNELMLQFYSAMERDYLAYSRMNKSGSHGKTVRANFMMAWTSRVNIRLRELKNELVAQRQGLIVVKQDLIQTHMTEKMNIGKLRSTKSVIKKIDHAGLAAGHAAGDVADIGIARKVEA